MTTFLLSILLLLNLLASAGAFQSISCDQEKTGSTTSTISSNGKMTSSLCPSAKSSNNNSKLTTYLFTGNGKEVTIGPIDEGTDFDVRIQVFKQVPNNYGYGSRDECVVGFDNAIVSFTSEQDCTYKVHVYGSKANEEGDFKIKVYCDKNEYIEVDYIVDSKVTLSGTFRGEANGDQERLLEGVYKDYFQDKYDKRFPDGQVTVEFVNILSQNFYLAKRRSLLRRDSFHNRFLQFSGRGDAVNELGMQSSTTLRTPPHVNHMIPAEDALNHVRRRLPWDENDIIARLQKTGDPYLRQIEQVRTEVISVRQVIATCTNMNSRCEYWARIGECSANPAYMTWGCKRSCGLCNDDNRDDGGDGYENGAKMISNYGSGRYIYAGKKYITWQDFVGASSEHIGGAEHKWRLISTSTCSQSYCYRIQNIVSGRCLYAQVNKSGEDGVGAGPCKYQDNIWYLLSADCPRGDCYYIVNDASKRRLYATKDKNGKEGFGAVNCSCETDDRKWYIDRYYDYSTFRPEIHNGYCMDIPNSNTNNGVNIHMYQCYRGADQYWAIDEDGHIRSKLNPNKCLDLEGPTVTNGSPIEVWDCIDDYLPQKWRVTSAGEIRSQWLPHQCIDFANAQIYNGNKIQIWDCNGENSQKWTYF